MITYKKGDLFTAPKDAILAHACNGQGVWGAGVAAIFRKLFPDEYVMYNKACMAGVVGGELVMAGRVACLITSPDFGSNKDGIQEILANTEVSFKKLLRIAHREIHMPKINSGIFGVPWHLTEQVVLKCIKEYPGDAPKVVVWEL